PAVASVAVNELFAPFGDGDPVVGEHPVEIHDEGAHGCGQSSEFVAGEALAHEGGGDEEVVLVVHLDAPFGRDRVDRGAAGEAAPLSEKSVDPYGVDGTYFEVIFGPLLAHGPIP